MGAPTPSVPAVRVWHPETFEGLELKRGTTDAGPSAPHVHDAYQIGLIETGATLFRYRGSRWVAPAGSLMVIHPGEVHENVSSGARGFAGLYADPASLEALGVAAPGSPAPFVAGAVVDEARAVGLFAAAFGGFEEPATLMERETRLLRAFVHLFGAHGDRRAPARPVGREHPAVARAKEVIHGCYHEAVSLADLSAATGLHKNHVLNVFTRQVGLSPHRYLLNVRIGHAKRLLRRGVPIAEVAAATGFSDQSHLNREFRKQVLVTPGAYRGGGRTRLYFVQDAAGERGQSRGP